MPQANGLFVDFTLPSVQVMGTVESDGPSTYKGRFRAELLVNGHSVWTSEGHRLNYLHTNDPNECTATSEKSSALLDYGAPTGLASTPATPAPGKKVTLGLGQFAAGQAVEALWWFAPIRRSTGNAASEPSTACRSRSAPER